MAATLCSVAACRCGAGARAPGLCGPRCRKSRPRPLAPSLVQALLPSPYPMLPGLRVSYLNWDVFRLLGKSRYFPSF